MPHQWNYPRVPEVAILGSSSHRRAVKCLYRITLKYFKYSTRFRYDVWDWNCLNIRKYFEKSKNMDEVEQALNTYKDVDMYIAPWDGPKGAAFMRYPQQLIKYILILSVFIFNIKIYIKYSDNNKWNNISFNKW